MIVLSVGWVIVGAVVVVVWRSVRAVMRRRSQQSMTDAWERIAAGDGCPVCWSDRYVDGGVIHAADCEFDRWWRS